MESEMKKIKKKNVRLKKKNKKLKNKLEKQKLGKNNEDKEEEDIQGNQIEELPVKNEELPTEELPKENDDMDEGNIVELPNCAADDLHYTGAVTISAPTMEAVTSKNSDDDDFETPLKKMRLKVKCSSKTKGGEKTGKPQTRGKKVLIDDEMHEETSIIPSPKR